MDVKIPIGKSDRDREVLDQFLHESLEVPGLIRIPKEFVHHCRMLIII